MQKIIVMAGMILFFGLALCFAQETLTITTYYPSPYGVYRELQWGDFPNTRGRLGASEGSYIELGGAGTPYIDFLNDMDMTNDFDMRIVLQENDKLAIIGGNVGIETLTPTATLHVNGNIKAMLNDIAGVPMEYNSASYEIGFDIAEIFEANEEVEPGDVLCIDENGKLKKGSLAYDVKVAGIVSEAPAILFEGNQLQIAPQAFEFKRGSKPPLALAGRVRCKVTTQEGGMIKIGDLLVTSFKPGHAMKANLNKLKPGMVLGKALEPLEKGEGKIMILVTLQ